MKQIFIILNIVFASAGFASAETTFSGKEIKYRHAETYVSTGGKRKLGNLNGQHLWVRPTLNVKELLALREAFSCPVQNFSPGISGCENEGDGLIFVPIETKFVNKINHDSDITYVLCNYIIKYTCMNVEEFYNYNQIKPSEQKAN